MPVGPFQVKVKLPQDVRGGEVRFLVSGARAAADVREGWAVFEVKSLLDHEVAVIA
ncbi:MAG: hypothetical protein M1541_10900 [Acidobacteria bacterium]|nr:hypothetical protein [Acidobacteriota bacterium]